MPETLSALAKALEIPQITILRKAGILPPAPEANELVEQIVHETSNMPEQDQQEILAFIRMKNNLREKGKKK